MWLSDRETLSASAAMMGGKLKINSFPLHSGLTQLLASLS